MRSRKNSQSSDSTNSGANQSDASSYGQANDADQDLMCLVYPDGSTTTVVPQSHQS
ncbi:MAG: hypothetical protein WBA76_07685 [Phormidesmis sp.]